MIAKILAIAAAVQTASAVSTITFDCGTDSRCPTDPVSVVRYMVAGQYVEAVLTCANGDEKINGDLANTLQVPTGTRIAIFPLVPGVTYESEGFCEEATGNTPSLCQTASLTSTAVTVTVGAELTSTTAYAFIDCSRVTAGVSVTGSFREYDAVTTATAAERFVCSSTSFSVPTSSFGAPWGTVVGVMGFTKMPEPLVGRGGVTPFTYEVALTTSNGASITPIRRLIADPVATATTVAYTGTCAVSTSFAMQSCTLTNPAAGVSTWFFPIVGGVAAVEACEYTCNAIGNTASCDVTTSTTVASICAAEAASFVSVECPTGTSTGGVVTCVLDDADLTNEGFNQAIAAINASPNPAAAGAAFLAILRGSVNGGAYSSECGTCVAQTLAGGGQIDCAVCAAVQSRRQQASTVSVVFCPQANAASQVTCLEQAACAGALNGAVCLVAGQTVACPTCPVAAAEEESSSSKKGLLGLLGLLAIIPLVLILCSCCLLCVLLARKKKRAVLVPPPTVVAPMTVAEPAIVCGGTGMPTMSPYGSAYPCM